MTCGASNTRHGMPGFLSTELRFTAIRWLETKHSEKNGVGTGQTWPLRMQILDWS